MLIDTFFEKGRTFLDCKYPIMCGAMTWVSDPQLVSAIGNAGGFGLLAGGNTPIDVFERQIIETGELTEGPFGVNLITLAPVYQGQLELVCKLGCPVVVFAGGIPRKDEIKKAKRCGAKVICFAPTAPLAHKLIQRGADALILEGLEAGGHIGPVALSVLIQQILFNVDTVPIFIAGGIATGRMMAHLLMMGAAGIQMGTRFVMAEECIAHPKFKETFRKAKAKDAIATPQFDSRLPVIPVRALKNEGSIEFSKLQLELLNKLDENLMDRLEAQYKVEEFWVGALRRAVIDGDVAKGSLMAGQSVGLVDKVQPLNDIIEELVSDAETELQRLKSIFNQECSP
ncbi:MAG: nitronate monooxygenase family protein [Desulfobacterales bacterium]|jgi:enoyl-[acyl-carrier protein] reductase II